LRASRVDTALYATRRFDMRVSRHRPLQHARIR
jgi:hypothetical protein